LTTAFEFTHLLPLVCISMALSACESKPTPTTTLGGLVRAGLRASSYGPQAPFPEPDYWVNTSRAMVDLFPPAKPSLVWIVGVMEFQGTSGIARLNFPAPKGQGASHADILFEDVDKNEAYLDRFDREGMRVWLQVEPGNSDVLQLIDLVLGRYASHPCIMGFGVDVEWYKWDSVSADEGRAVSDAEAQAWSERVRSYNPDFQLFTKHWLTGKMPPTYRTGMAFIDDSQEFPSLNAMVAEFAAWGHAFAPSPVGFQYGYEADQQWWGSLDNPPLDIGTAILEAAPNTSDLYWVDFTMEQIWQR
jgi:hypothetical protein